MTAPIPKGWRRLKQGEKILKGDRWWGETTKQFHDCHFSIGEKFDPAGANSLTIRRKPKPATPPPEPRVALEGREVREKILLDALTRIHDGDPYPVGIAYTALENWAAHRLGKGGRKAMTIADQACALLLAWEVGVDGVFCIVFATTAPKARWIAVKSYRNAGYGRPGVWPRSLVARREPDLDSSPLRREPNRCCSPEYVRNYP